MSQTDASASTEALPSRGSLLLELRRLQQVSVELEQLISRVELGDTLGGPERSLMEHLTQEQGVLVDTFVALCQDAEAVERYRVATRTFQNDIQALKEVDDEATLAALRERVGGEIEAWIGALRHVIDDVMGRAS